MVKLNKYFKKNVFLVLAIILVIIANVYFALNVSIIESRVINSIGKDSNLFFKLIILLVINYILLVIISSLNKFLNSFFSEKIGKNLVVNFTNDIVNQQIKDIKNDSEYFSNIVNIIEKVKDDYFGLIFKLIYEIIFFVVSMVIIIKTSKEVFFVIICTIISSYLYSLFIQKRVDKEINIYYENLDKHTISISNLFKGITYFFFANKRKTFKEKLNELFLDIKGKAVRYSLIRSVLYTSLTAFNFYCQIFVIIITAYYVILEKINYGMFYLIIEITSTISYSLPSILEKYNDIISTKKLYNKLNSEIIPNSSEKQEDIDDIQLISLKNVNIYYDNNLVLKDINLEFTKGKKYLIIGQSGIGKSTLVKLLINGIKNYSGEVLINNLEISKINEKSLFNNISYIDSQNFIFNANILDNISIFDEKYKDKKILDYFNIGQIDKNLILNESNISTGQKQRISIIRNLVRNKNFIIFDEASSNLDKKNRDIVDEYILTSDFTVCYITHYYDDKLKNKFDYIIEIKDKEVKYV